MMTKQELERWLCGVDRRSDFLVNEDVLDLSLATLVESVLSGVPNEQSQLRLTVALLHDIFSDDGDARRRLRWRCYRGPVGRSQIGRSLAVEVRRWAALNRCRPPRSPRSTT